MIWNHQFDYVWDHQVNALAYAGAIGASVMYLLLSNSLIERILGVADLFHEYQQFNTVLFDLGRQGLF